MLQDLLLVLISLLKVFWKKAPKRVIVPYGKEMDAQVS